MHDTTAWHWPAIPSSDLISLAPTTTTTTTSALVDTTTSPKIPTPITTASAVTATDGAPLPQMGGAGQDLQDAPEADSERQGSAPGPGPDDGTALAMSGSTGPPVSDSSVRNFSPRMRLVCWSIVCLVASHFL